MLGTSGAGGGVSIHGKLGPRRSGWPPHSGGVAAADVGDARGAGGSRRVLGLFAQTGTIIATRPHLGVDLSARLDVAEAALWTGLHSLLTYGGHPMARR